MSNDSSDVMRNLLLGIGWTLLGFGGCMIAPGIIAMTGLTPLELDFFGIEIDTQPERIAWTVGSIISAVGGYAILRKLKGFGGER